MNNKKHHYWTLTFKCYEGTYTTELTTQHKFVNRTMINSCIHKLSKGFMLDKSSILLTACSYLGEMSQEEWEG